MPPFFGVVRFDGLPGGEDGLLPGLGGSPPVFLSDRRVALIADARIDNRNELLPELQAHGLLAGDGDAALLLAAWLRWGESCLDRLAGDFAFALWDARSRRLFCARDPLGIKPLCFARLGSGLLAVASEAQQILRLPQVSPDLDEVVLGEYLAGLPQSPRHTFFRAVERLPPGHRLTVDAAGLRLDRWWEPPAPGTLDPGSEMECAAQFRDLFERAVADRLRTSRSTVGIALSGGLDSGSIAAVAQARAAAGGPKVLGTTFIFDEIPECDERDHVQALAAATGLEVAWIQAEQNWLLSDAGAHGSDLEGPFQGWQACHRKALEAVRARGGDVLLTGHGADDLLRGSSRIYADRLARGDFGALCDVLRTAGDGRWRAFYRYLARPLLPPTAHRALRRLTGRRTVSRLPDWISPDLVRRAALSERIARLERPGTWGRMAPAEIRSVALEHPGFEQVVHWHERHGRALGVDVRHPFLDKRLFEYVLSLPPERTFQLGTSKPLLREAVRGILPERLRLRRDKTTFDRFLVYSLEREAGRIEEILREPRIAALGFVDADRLRKAFTALREGSFFGMRRTFWFAVTLELWLQRHSTLLRQGGSEPKLRLPPAA